MKRIVVLLLCLTGYFVFGQNDADPTKMRIAKLKYEGGGDWYSNPTSLPNLIDYVNRQSAVSLASTEDVVEPGSTQLYQYPYVYMTGHGNVSFSDSEARNLRSYLIAGGFLHVDDNYGMDKYIRRELKKVFPELELVELPFSHPVFHQHFDFENGLPKIHEHDNKPAQALALIHDGRIAVLYTYECDLGDGWEDPSVHNDPVPLREQALQMGANILLYALLN
jgi:hypothetical protein